MYSTFNSPQVPIVLRTRTAYRRVFGLLCRKIYTERQPEIPVSAFFHRERLQPYKLALFEEYKDDSNLRQ